MISFCVYLNCLGYLFHLFVFPPRSCYSSMQCMNFFPRVTNWQSLSLSSVPSSNLLGLCGCNIAFCFILFVTRLLLLWPGKEAGDVWCPPRVWNLRAVIWFQFTISSLCRVLLLFLSSFFYLLAHSPDFSPNNSSIFFVKRQTFFYGSCVAARS